MFKFLHAADIHLDSPLKGLTNYEGLPAEEIRLATRHALDRLVALAIEQKVQFVLIAGDIYDGDWKDNRTGLFFHSRLSRLRERGIHVYLIKGNHDAASVMTKSLPVPENTHIFDIRKASSMKVPDVSAVIHGQSFPNRKVDENLAVDYPARDPHHFNIGMLHTSLEGNPEHTTYAPCSANDLRLKGYEYWALGHIHNASVVLGGDPWIVYPGNIQGRSIRETGAKGCRIVTVDDMHRVTSCEFFPLDLFRWMELQVDISGLHEMNELEPAVDKALRTIQLPDGVQLIVRLTLNGTTALTGQLIAKADWKDGLRALATDIGAERIWLEKIEVKCTVPRQPQNMGGPLAELAETLSGLRGFDTEPVFENLLAKLPDDLKELVRNALNPAGAEYEQLLTEVESLLHARLSGQAVADAD
jgi:exonuclease SbcD